MDRRLNLLRGRVAIEPIAETKIGSIYLPDMQGDWDRRDERAAGKLAMSSHRGRVLALGPPAEQHGHPVPHGFEVGDEVVFVFGAQGTEASRRGYYGDTPCVWIAQEEVQAVIECASYLECGGDCRLPTMHAGGHECIGDDRGKPGTCPA